MGCQGKIAAIIWLGFVLLMLVNVISQKQALIRMRILTFLLLFPVIINAQSNKQDLWKPMKFFEGEWIGNGEGEPGKGAYQRKYQFVLNKNFMEVENKAAYPPTDNNPKGEIHEDKGLVSYDGSRKKFILRQFHSEGFVNTYVLDSISADGKTIIFTTEQIENIPPGWKAREVWQILGDNQFSETFELAEPGKDFSIYTKATFTRK